MAERRPCIAETDIAPGTACTQGSAENKVRSPAGGGDFIGVYAYEANAAKKAGEALGVVIYGLAKVLAGGDVSAGSFAEIKDASGAFVNAGGSGRVCGMFLQDGAAGEYVEMLVAPAPAGGGSGGGGADPNAVHKTGDETIDGVKTFVQAPVLPEKDAPSVWPISNPGTALTGVNNTAPATEAMVYWRVKKPDNSENLNPTAGILLYAHDPSNDTVVANRDKTIFVPKSDFVTVEDAVANADMKCVLFEAAKNKKFTQVVVPVTVTANRPPELDANEIVCVIITRISRSSGNAMTASGIAIGSDTGKTQTFFLSRGMRTTDPFDLAWYSNKEIPAPPAADGVYTLQCEITGGVPAYSWV